MVALATFVLAALSSAVAQQPPPPGPAQPTPQSMPVAAPMQQQPLQTGPCLDSLRAVPRVLQAPVSRGMQIVRIDQVLSTATMTPNEIIGFLYTLQDGSTWLGQRTKDYQSASDATAINRVLSATHVPGYNVTGFPPTTVYGVPTKHPQIFRVQIPANALGPLQIEVAPCVMWPSDRALPDPRM